MLDLYELTKGFPAITASFGQYLAEAGAVCLESQGHKQGKSLRVQGKHSVEYSLHWPNVTDQMLSCLNDPEVATEHGAVGIAVLLTKKLEGYSVIQRSSSLPEKVVVRGILCFADATHKDSGQIKIIDEETKTTHLVKVPEGMMNDIVKPLWDSVVVVKGTKSGQYITLDDIEEE